MPACIPDPQEPREMVCVPVTQSCPTLCDPLDYSPPGSSVHVILQARLPEWVALSFSREVRSGDDWNRWNSPGGGTVRVKGHLLESYWPPWVPHSPARGGGWASRRDLGGRSQGTSGTCHGGPALCSSPTTWCVGGTQSGFLVRPSLTGWACTDLGFNKKEPSSLRSVSQVI